VGDYLADNQLTLTRQTADSEFPPFVEQQSSGSHEPSSARFQPLSDGREFGDRVKEHRARQAGAPGEVPSEEPPPARRAAKPKPALRAARSQSSKSSARSRSSDGKIARPPPEPQIHGDSDSGSFSD
jgi:hypothetical protein